MSWLNSRRKRRVEAAPPSTSEARLSAAIEAAQVIERHCAGEDGDYVPRVFIVCHALGGMFLFGGPEEALARMQHYFPDLSEAAAIASARHLTDRVRAELTSKSLPEVDTPRRRWMDWRDDGDDDSIFRF